jgi:hypothetical protein
MVVNDSTWADTGYGVLAAASTTFYWRVRARNGNWPGEWSSTRSFTRNATPATPVISRIGKPSLRMQISGRMLRFELSAPSRVSLRILDLRGVSRQVLLDETRGAGQHIVALPHYAPHGIYLLEYRVGSYREVLKIIP